MKALQRKLSVRELTNFLNPHLIIEAKPKNESNGSPGLGRWKPILCERKVSSLSNRAPPLMKLPWQRWANPNVSNFLSQNLRIQTQTWQLGAKQWKQFGRGRKQGREESDNQVSWRWRWQSKWRKESGNLILLIWKPLAVTKQFTFGISLTISSSELSGQEGRRAGLDEESWKELQRSPINNQPSPITSRTTMDIRPGENLRYLKLGRLNVKAFKYIQFEKIPQVRFSMSTGEGAQSSGSNVWDLLRWIQPGFSGKIM